MSDATRAEWHEMRLDPRLRAEAEHGADLTAIALGTERPMWRRIEGCHDVGGELAFDGPEPPVAAMDLDDFVAVMTCADRYTLPIVSLDDA